MAQGYRVIMKKNLSGKEGEPEQKAYAIPKYNGNTDMDTLCKVISARSSMSSADVKAVLDNLNFVLDMELQAGRIVQLGEFGNFRLSLSSAGADTKSGFSSSMLKKAKIIFTPGKSLKTTVQTTGFVSMEKSDKSAADGGDASQETTPPNEFPDEF